MTSSARSRLRARRPRGVELAVSDEAAVTVVLAAGGYPERFGRGNDDRGLEDAEAAGALVFHAGTALRGDRLVTNGGRILGVTGTGPTVADARERAYAAASGSGSRGCSTAATSRSTRPPRRAGLDRPSRTLDSHE